MAPAGDLMSQARRPSGGGPKHRPPAEFLTKAKRLVSLGFSEGQVREALTVAKGDEALAKEVLQQWQKVPPPSFLPAKARTAGFGEDLQPLSERAADIAEKAANWVHEAGGGSAALFGKLRNSLKLEDISQIIHEASASVGLTPEPANRRDSYEEFYGYAAGGMPEPVNMRDNYQEFYDYSPDSSPPSSSSEERPIVHLPDQDLQFQVDTVEAPLEESLLVETNPKADFIVNGAHKSWAVLRKVSTLFPMDVVAGLGMNSMPASKNNNQQWAYSQTQPASRSKRQTEIAALLAQGWMSPRSVRRLKKELQGLQQRAAEEECVLDRRDLTKGLDEGAAVSLSPRTAPAPSCSISSSKWVQGRGASKWTPDECRGSWVPAGSSCSPPPASVAALQLPLAAKEREEPAEAGSEAAAQKRSASPSQLAASLQPGTPDRPDSPSRDPGTCVEGTAAPGVPLQGLLAQPPLAAGAVEALPGSGVASTGGVPPAADAGEGDHGGEAQRSSCRSGGPPTTGKGEAVPPAGKGPAPPPGKAAAPPTGNGREGAPTTGKGEAPPPAGKGEAPPPGKAAAPPAGKGKAPPAGKGAGKGKGPPAKGLPPGGKGAPPGKGSAPGSACSRQPLATPIGRRFEWKMLSKDKVAGTVFANLSAEVSVDVSCLRALFEKPKDSLPAPKAKAAKVQPELELLTRARAQNIMIALRKQPLTAEVLQALEQLDLDASVLTPEACEVLIGAVPTDEEAKQLKSYRGDVMALREAERQVLPLTRLERPAVGQRLRLTLFSRVMADLAGDVKCGLTCVQTALDDARNSAAFQALLCHTVRLGTIINFGPSRADSDAEVGAQVRGFNLDALPRLSLFKALGNSRITLLHVLVAQISAADEDLPRRLLDDLSSVHKAAKRPIAPLAEDVAAFCSGADHVLACAAFRGGTAEPGDEVAARLARFAELAAAEAGMLKEQLTSTREAAKATLSFFAVAAQPKDVDAKALELCSLLIEFLGAFERARAELTRSPDLAAACHSKAPAPRRGQ